MKITFKELLTSVNPFANLIGFTVDQCEDGLCKSRLAVTEQLLNVHRVVHGGVIYSLIDTSMGYALYSTLAEGEQCTTIEIKINYLKPVTSGDLYCQTRLIQKGQRIGVIESDVYNQEKLIARAMGTFSIIKAIY